MTLEARPVRSKDKVPFTCRLCGACCRDLEDKLMLEPMDAYYLARHLRDSGDGVSDIEDVYARFAHASLLNDIYPIFLVNTQGEDQSCVLLENGQCSVYEARPRACRLYPFSVDAGMRGQRFTSFQSIDCHQGHFTGRGVSVENWIYENFTRDAREFVESESGILTELGRLLRKLGEVGRRSTLFQVMYYRYYNYDLDQPFLPQYQANQKALLEALRRDLPKEE